MLFREYHESSRASVRTWLPAGSRVRFTHLLGHGADFTSTVDRRNEIECTLPGRYTFALYAYEIEH